MKRIHVKTNCSEAKLVWLFYLSGLHKTNFIFYFSTIAPFNDVWSRERGKYEPVMPCSVPV